jgi:hypothetical protein
MTDKEALLEALEALHYCEALNRDVDERKMQAITVIRKLWTEHAMQEVQRLGQEIEQSPVAQVWDEGYRQGIQDERMSEAYIGVAGFGAKVEPARQNPYGATPPQRTRVVFPTMLRKMWSGSEVQAWLDENVNKENT